MTTPEQRWAAIVDAEVVGDPISPLDRRFLESYERQHPGCRAEEDPLADLAQWYAEGEPNTPNDEAMVTAAVDEAMPSRSGRGGWTVGVVALAAAAALVLVFVGGREPPDRAVPDRSTQVAAAPSPPESDPAPLESATTTERGESAAGPRPDCQSLSIGRSCARAKARYRVLPAASTEGSSAVELHKGTLDMDVGPSAVELWTQSGTVVGSDAAFVVTVERDVVRISVARGSVEVRRVDGANTTLTAGETWSHSIAPTRRDDPRAPRTSAAESLAEAQRLGRAKDIEGAARAYRALLRRFPRSGEARLGLVALGQLELGPLRAPKAALRHFERYLQGGRGSLREEARRGQVRALRQLGRADQERSAITAFLRDHTGAADSSAMRQRLHALEPSP